MVGLERRAFLRGGGWTQPDNLAWSRSQAKDMLEQGLQKFRRLPQNVKLSMWEIFASWDDDRSETVSSQEFVETLCALGFIKPHERVANNLVRLVDHDGTQELNWRKFKALMTLATVDMSEQDMHEDLEIFFKLVDADRDDIITIEELASWSTDSKIGMNKEDFALVMYKFFQKPRQTVNKQEFLRWMGA